MPKVTRDKESPAPKKKTRKAASNGNGVAAEGGNGVPATPVTVSTEVSTAMGATASLEEQIRARAYELYLQRGDNGGSPEQDWLRAAEEICGRQRTA